MVAGTAPLSRTRDSQDNAVCRLIGGGMPCVTKAVSKATTGLPCASASLTSSDIMRDELVGFIDDVRRLEGFTDINLTGR